MESGHISIHAENILPIIKRWLYSEKEIFLRELVANATDAVLKLQKLALIGEVQTDVPEARIDLAIDKAAGTLMITDTGLGMTEDEIKKYINQVAFSGVADFLEKYKDKDDSQQVIGHFGLGFYSAFMVATTVEIDTLSCQAGAKAAHWRCDGSTEFTLTDSARTAIGTTITLHIAPDSLEMLEKETVKGLLQRYCAFIRYPIYLEGELVNDPKPIWNRSPSEVKDEDYLEFFRKLFPQSPDPLFWIHLNLDYPFNLKGVLFFPKLTQEMDQSQGEIKLYCNQVYVADNVKELVPDFLMLLKGVMDCPDLPLNVSRSYLQTDPTVRKIAEHVTKKVADRLSGMAKTERETYEKHWSDIHGFVKFGMLRDSKFFDKMQDHVIFKSSGDGYVTLAEYKERMQGKVDDGTVIYCADPNAQAGYLRMLKDLSMEAVIADSMIDQHFIPYLEMKSSGAYKFKRVDADLTKHLVADAGEAQNEDLVKIFNDNLERDQVKIRVETLKTDKVPAMLLIEETARRMRDMSKTGMMAAFAADFPVEQTLVINQGSPAVKNLIKLALSPGREDEVKLVVNQIYDLAWLQQGDITAERMQTFIDRSTAILGRLGVQHA